MKELYLAGKIAELLAAFEGMKGVEEVVAGRAKASGELEVKCVRVQYNPKKTDICELLKKYFNEGVTLYHRRRSFGTGCCYLQGCRRCSAD